MGFLKRERSLQDEFESALEGAEQTNFVPAGTRNNLYAESAYVKGSYNLRAYRDPGTGRLVQGAITNVQDPMNLPEGERSVAYLDFRGDQPTARESRWVTNAAGSTRLERVPADEAQKDVRRLLNDAKRGKPRFGR